MIVTSPLPPLLRGEGAGGEVRYFHEAEKFNHRLCL